jgi:hypothetical protein
MLALETKADIAKQCAEVIRVFARLRDNEITPVEAEWQMKELVRELAEYGMIKRQEKLDEAARRAQAERKLETANALRDELKAVFDANV